MKVSRSRTLARLTFVAEGCTLEELSEGYRSIWRIGVLGPPTLAAMDFHI